MPEKQHQDQDSKFLQTPELDMALTGESWERIAGQLNDLLRSTLLKQLEPSGQFGAALANALSVMQCDFYINEERLKGHDLNDVGRSEFGKVGELLTDQLRKLLLENGVPVEQVKRSYVRRLGINFGLPGTPGCKYYEYVDGEYIEYCYRGCSTC